VELLRNELKIQQKLLEEKWHFSLLERIFIENRIYRDIEECETWSLIIDTISEKLKPFENDLNRGITEDDIISLTEIKIKRISRYDHLRHAKSIQSIELEIKEIANDIKHIIHYSIRYFEHLIKKYGDTHERKTTIQEFDSISAKSVVIANKKLYINKKEGFIGTKLKSDEFVCKCSSIDDIIVFMEDGKYIVTQVDDKKYIGKNIIYANVWKKNDNHMIYNIIYKDGLNKISYVKRFSVTSLIKDRLYDATQSNDNSKILYFTPNPNSESEVVNISLHSKSSAKNKLFEYDFSNLSIKSRQSKGNILSKYQIRKVVRKSIGESTLGGRKLWVDENIGRLNTENRGIYLGSFNSDDKIIVFYNDGSYEMTNFDMSNRYKMNDIIIIEKFIIDKIYSLIYKDGKNKAFYIKRFTIATCLISKRFNLISENRGSKCLLISNYRSLYIHYNYRLKNGDKKNKKVLVDDFIDIKGYKAIGKILDNKLRMSGFNFEKSDVNENNPDESVSLLDGKPNELTLF